MELAVAFRVSSWLVLRWFGMISWCFLFGIVVCRLLGVVVLGFEFAVLNVLLVFSCLLGGFGSFDVVF